jgi:hypothetical protein
MVIKALAKLAPDLLATQARCGGQRRDLGNARLNCSADSTAELSSDRCPALFDRGLGHTGLRKVMRQQLRLGGGSGGIVA